MTARVGGEDAGGMDPAGPIERRHAVGKRSVGANQPFGNDRRSVAGPVVAGGRDPGQVHSTARGLAVAVRECRARDLSRVDTRRSAEKSRTAAGEQTDEQQDRGRSHDHQSTTRRSRSALPITDTELSVMAALAHSGLITIPKKGYSRPAATGTPTAL